MFPPCLDTSVMSEALEAPLNKPRTVGGCRRGDGVDCSGVCLLGDGSARRLGAGGSCLRLPSTLLVVMVMMQYGWWCLKSEVGWVVAFLSVYLTFAQHQSVQ